MRKICFSGDFNWNYRANTDGDYYAVMYGDNWLLTHFRNMFKYVREQ